jgi:predicted DNA-binding transcriptional regulator AlpA
MTAVLDLTALAPAIEAAVGRALAGAQAPTATGWRERLWTCDPQTRLYLDEVADGIGKSRPAVRALIKRRGLPVRKRGGELVFLAGEVRAWLEGQETVLVAAIPRRRAR